MHRKSKLVFDWLARRLNRLRVLSRHVSVVIAICVLQISCSGYVNSDEVIVDEAMTNAQTVGDFEVSKIATTIDLDQAELFNESGEMVSGHLYTFFKNQGIESVDELRLCLDIDPNVIRADYALNSIEFTIEDLKSNRDRQFSMGVDNSLRIPGYETSSRKPEAQIAIKLDYDFMKEFNANSTEKLKFKYLVDGEEREISPAKVAVLPERPHFNAARLPFMIAFCTFWVFVFLILFRMTTPKSQNAASPA